MPRAARDERTQQGQACSTATAWPCSQWRADSALAGSSIASEYASVLAPDRRCSRRTGGADRLGSLWATHAIRQTEK